VYREEDKDWNHKIHTSDKAIEEAATGSPNTPPPQTQKNKTKEKSASALRPIDNPAHVAVMQLVIICFL